MKSIIKFPYYITIFFLFLCIGTNTFGEIFRGPIPAQPPVPLVPRYAPKFLPAVPGVKPISIDLTQLQKQYQELRAQRDRLEKEIDIAVGKIRQTKNELKNAENPLSKFYYRRQLEIQLESFREKIDQLGIVESRLSAIIREFGKRITNEPGPVRPNPILRPTPFSNHPPRLIPLPAQNPLLEPEPLIIPLGFDQWYWEDKIQYLQTQIQRISEEKKQLDTVLQQHQKDLMKLKKMLEEIQPANLKPRIP